VNLLPKKRLFYDYRYLLNLFFREKSFKRWYQPKSTRVGKLNVEISKRTTYSKKIGSNKRVIPFKK